MLGLLARRLRTSTLARGASTTMVARVYGAALAYATQLYLASRLGAEELGRFAFAWTWLSVLAFLMPLGFDTSLVRFIPAFEQQSAPGRLKAILRLGQRATLGLSMLVSAIALAALLLLSGESTYFDTVWVAALALPAVSLMHLYEGIARGFQWISQVSIPMYVLRPTLLFVGAACAIEVMGQRTGQATMIVAALACLATAIYQLLRYRRSLPGRIREARPVPTERSWIGASVPMMLVASFELMIANTDILMMGLLRGPADTGVYNLVVRTACSLLLIFFALSAFAAPRIAALHAAADRHELHRFCRRVQLWMFGPTLLGLITLVVSGRWLLQKFGDPFELAYVPMIVLGVGVTTRAACGPVDNLLTMTGRQGAVAASLGVAALLNLIGNSLLIPRYGAHGAATSTALTMAFELTLISIVAYRHTGFSAIPWRRSSDVAPAREERSP